MDALLVSRVPSGTTESQLRQSKSISRDKQRGIHGSEAGFQGPQRRQQSTGAGDMQDPEHLETKKAQEKESI